MELSHLDFVFDKYKNIGKIGINLYFIVLATTARFARLRGSLRLRGLHWPFYNKILPFELNFFLTKFKVNPWW